MAGMEQNFLEATSLKGGESLLGLVSALCILGEALFLAFLSPSVLLTLTALTARGTRRQKGALKGKIQFHSVLGITLIRLN